MNILLVEPDLLLAATYASALTKDGHDVRVVQSAQLAVSYMDDHTPDLVVLELELREHSGVEFLYEMRSYPEWEAVAVIVHSMVPRQRMVGNKALNDLGISDYLYKPQTSLTRLLQAVSDSKQRAAA